MNSYCAFLGHQPAISIAELQAVLPDMTVQHTVDRGSVLVFNSAEEIDQAFLNRLGGTILIAKQASSNVLELSDVPNVLYKKVEQCKAGKVTFSIRSLGISTKEVLNAYRDCKEYLRKKDRSSRYLGNEKKSAPAVALHDNDMITGKKGAEIVIIRTKQETDIVLWIGYTVAAQDVNAYTKRDMYKPVRDTEVGLLPPKLAQIMVNFGLFALQNIPGTTPGSTKKVTLYDPFCGTGVLLMEALLARMNVVGSDNSKKAIADSTKNIQWLVEQYPSTAKHSWQVNLHDATKAFKPDVKADVLVTETTLGPNLHKRANIEEAKRYCSEIEEIEEQFLRNAKQAFPHAPIVMMLPVWYTNKHPVQLKKVWNVIKKLGYDAILPTESATDQTLSLIYRRPEQFVGREIVILVPQSHE